MASNVWGRLIRTNSGVTEYGSGMDYDNYIIAHHLHTYDNTGHAINKVYRIPLYPDEVTDILTSNFRATEVLGRTAPLQAYSGSGPRVLSFSLKLHRDIDYIYDPSEAREDDRYKLSPYSNINDLINEIHAINLPNYSEPMQVEPPEVTVRIGKGLRITGLPDITFSYGLPLDKDGNYQSGTLSVKVTELQPYDANSVLADNVFSARGKSLYGNY